MIGYYVHHHGSGHLHRMRAITAHIDEPVTVLSSLPCPEDFPGPDLPRTWVQLERDDDGVDAFGPAAGGADVTAHATLHWVPRHHAGLAARMARISDWVRDQRPRLLVVDVSVEVGLLARLCGVPVTVVAMPGDRTDPAHRLAYDQADLLVAPWPPGLEEVGPDPARPGSGAWPARWRDKTVWAGGISRYDDRVAAGSPTPASRQERTGLVLWGSGGSDGAGWVEHLRRATPDWDWTVASPERPLTMEQVWDRLRSAQVVLTHAGQNSVAEVAAARTPAVVVADDRPFGEQRHTARRLRHLGLAATVDVPSADGWADLPWTRLLDEAVALGGDGWKSWNDGLGAQRAAAAIREAAGA